MSETASINIQIGNRSYPLKVQQQDESIYREAEKLINDKWKAYGEAFAVRDPQDLLAMCAIQLATETLKLKIHAENDTAAVNEEISSILKLMEQVV